MLHPHCWCWPLSLILTFAVTCPSNWAFSQMRAGIAKVDITNREAGPVNDPLYAKAVVFEVNKRRVVIASVDAVAIGEIGYIKNNFMQNVREQLQSRWQIDSTDFFVKPATAMVWFAPMPTPAWWKRSAWPSQTYRKCGLAWAPAPRIESPRTGDCCLPTAKRPMSATPMPCRPTNKSLA